MKISVLGGNWADFLIILLLLYYLWEGIERGFFATLFEFLGFLLSFFSALKFYPLASSFLIANFSFSHGIANALGFFLIGFITETIFYFLAQFYYQKIPKKLIASLFNRIFGFLPAVGNGILLLTFLLTLVITLPLNPNIKASILSSQIGGPLVLKATGVEKSLKEVFGEALNETLTFITVPPEGEKRVDLNFKVTEFRIDQASEKKMYEFTNNERGKRGLTLLTWDEKLTEIARFHAQDMFSRGYFSHYTPEELSPFDRLESGGAHFFVGGENLALAPNVVLAHQGLMASEGHRENILSPHFSKIGIGAVDGGIYGKMFVQEFTD